MTEQILRRGDVVMAPFGAEQFCPVIILSDGLYNQKSGTIIGVPLFKHKSTTHFPLAHTMSKTIEGSQYWAKPGQIKTFSALSLGYVIGHAENYDLDRILSGLHEIIGDPLK